MTVALYVLTCAKCGFVKKFLRDDPKEVDAGLPCTKCDGIMKRTPTPPSLHNKEVFQFGHQVRDVERFTDAAELYDERAHKDFRKPE